MVRNLSIKLFHFLLWGVAGFFLLLSEKTPEISGVSLAHYDVIRFKLPERSHLVKYGFMHNFLAY